jgi:hypothetical protein
MWGLNLKVPEALLLCLLQCATPPPLGVCGTGLGTQLHTEHISCAFRTCFPPCTLKARGAFTRTLKWLLKVPQLQPRNGCRGKRRAVVLPNRSPGAWPGQGLGLMAFTKLYPSSSFPEKGGARATHYHSVLTLKGVVLAWLLEWTESTMERAGGRRRWVGALPGEGRIRSLAQ